MVRVSPSFLVTGATETADGVMFRVQRLERGRTATLTNDVRVLHLDQVAIQISRGGAFYVLDRSARDGGAIMFRLEVRGDGAGRWTVQPADVPGAAEAVAALPSFPVLGFVRAPFACDAVQRAWPPTRLADSLV